MGTIGGSWEGLEAKSSLMLLTHTQRHQGKQSNMAAAAPAGSSRDIDII